MRRSQPRPVLPFPAQPGANTHVLDGVPRWCVRRYAAIGTDAVTIIAYDGEGYPLYDVRCKVGRAERVERDLARWLDEARDEQGMAPLRRTTLPFPTLTR